MKYISNAFSLNMLPDMCPLPLILEVYGPPNMEGIKSVVGHRTTAAILGLEFNRETIKLEPGDELYVAQYSGKRLPEGTKSLPNGAKFRWFKIVV